MPSGPQLEARLTFMARARGGDCYKFTSPGRRGVPDRIVVIPHTDRPTSIVFVEAKGAGDSLRPEQDREIAKLRAMDAHTVIVESYLDIEALFILL